MSIKHAWLLEWTITSYLVDLKSITEKGRLGQPFFRQITPSSM
jgi:hypothetical protein